ncbi:sensor domain-containing phosphodiesterase [Salmonella enterica subsp. enterica serovar Choleraesuis]|nr:sensor domain-containing phosphodiesterase [Salmonella enterica subsp. enterica serovar Choleraesuis]
MLPLILPVLLLPLAMRGNVYSQMDGLRIVLFYLPPALMAALLMIFSWAAIPGIILALLVHYLPMRGVVDSVVSVFHYLLPLTISYGGYRVFAPYRNQVIFGTPQLTTIRMFWLVFCNSTLFLFYYQIALFFSLFDAQVNLLGTNPFAVSTLINYQGVLVGTLTGLPAFYLLIRLIRNPHYLRALISQMRQQFHQRIYRSEVVLWSMIVAVLIGLLLAPFQSNDTIFNTNYTFTLLLPVMLWGAMRFGYLFIIIAWTMILLVLSHYYYRYLPRQAGFELQLAITSACYAVFSLTVFVMAIVTTRQRVIYEKLQRMAFIDPVLQMPNLRALSRDLHQHAGSVLCLLRFPELELLGRNYGVMVRTSYKQQLANWLRELLRPGEETYHLSGHELALRLAGETDVERIEVIDKHIQSFRFQWDGMPLQLQAGISYCYVRNPVSHLPLMLGELSAMADFSLNTHHPESLQLQGSRHIQRAIKDKVDMMNRLQQALDEGRFELFAQRIEGIRGDSYYEILVRMLGDNGELISPDDFLPVAHEFGLSSSIDLWIIEQTLRFVQRHRDHFPGLRLAINLSPASVCRSQFPSEVKQLLKRYSVEPWQIVFEITESNSLTNIELANQTLRVLQFMGCRVAIDDFGTGYASYARLKEMHADIMKIDGSFIRNILSSSLDYQIVESICQLARMKRMQVVAEYVETEEVREAVMKLGIDYMQGFLIGEPQRLDTLLPVPGGAEDDTVVPQSYMVR